MSEMTDEEALAIISGETSIAGSSSPTGTTSGFGLWPTAWQAARAALREKVAAQKAAKPKRPSLKVLAELMWSPEVRLHERPLTSKEIACDHAADILSALEKDVVPALREAATRSNAIQGVSGFVCYEMLRALGEEVP